MAGKKKYDLNPETLLYEITKEPVGRRFVRLGILLLLSALLTVLYFWIFVSVLGMDSPKTALLKKRHARWESKVALMNLNMDRYEEALDVLEMRNEDIYRSIFGMSPIPEEALPETISPSSVYFSMEQFGRNSSLREACLRLDNITRRTYLQSKSTDEVAALSKRAGDMASCVPAIPPIDPDPRNYHVTSPFGGREDPVYGGQRFHKGVDFSAKAGTPIYATGDGVISSVDFLFYGYGNMVVIDHGFGYVTRYAHMRDIFVVEGMKIKRGECIGTVGNSGKTTGAHLHYEVIYRGGNVNPANFYDLSMSSKEYSSMVSRRDEESPAVLRPQFRVKTR